MKKILASLLAAALAAGSAYAVTHSKKTFFMPRAVGVNKAMEHVGWHDLVYWQQSKRHSVRSEGANTRAPRSFVSVTGLYQQSLNNEALGNYFGVGNGLNSFRAGGRLDTATATRNDVIDSSVVVDGYFLIHNPVGMQRIDLGQANNKSPVTGTISFKPVAEVYGTRFDYWQDLGSPLKGLFVKASLPLVHVQQNVKMEIANAGTTTLHGKEFSLQDFFAGKVQITEADGTELLRPAAPPARPNPDLMTAANDKQNPLRRLKINGRRTAGGLADLTLALGYRYHQSETKHAHFTTHVVIPTGNKVKGEYLFEPVYGNGHHVGLGAGVNGGVQLWKGEKGTCSLTLSSQYTYLFEGSETRFPSLKELPMGHYYSAALLQQRAADVPTFEPLVNLLPGNVRVRPGSQLDSLVGLSFASDAIDFDFGYNLFWKDRESVWLKGNLPEVGLVARDASGDADFSDRNGVAFYQNRLLTLDDFDVTSIKNPAQITHKLFGGISYKPQWCKQYPTMISVGGAYEFVQDNAALEQYSVWVKGGIAF